MLARAFRKTDAAFNEILFRTYRRIGVNPHKDKILEYYENQRKQKISAIGAMCLTRRAFKLNFNRSKGGEIE